MDQDVEAHQPGTNAIATIMGDNDNIVDEDLDTAEAGSKCNNQQQTSCIFYDSCDDSMDWNTTKATIAYEQNAIQKRRAKGKIIYLDKVVAQKKENAQNQFLWHCPIHSPFATMEKK